MTRLPLSSVWYCSVPSGPKKTQLEVPWANNAHGDMRNSTESHSTKENFLIENLLPSRFVRVAVNNSGLSLPQPECWFYRLKCAGGHAGSFPKADKTKGYYTDTECFNEKKLFQEMKRSGVRGYTNQ